MNKRISAKSMIGNISFFIVLILISFYLLFRNNEMGSIWKVLHNVKLQYILMGVMCGLTFLFCQAINTRRVLKLLSYNPSYLNCLKYAFIGFFFSAITPSSSGGQPMQVYYMHKDKIEVPHSSLALLLELANYQFVTVSMAVIAYSTDVRFFNSINLSIRILIAVGVVLNLCMLVLILLAIFSKRVSQKLIDFIGFILSKLKIRKLDSIKITLNEHLEEYQAGAGFIKQNKGMMVSMCLITVIQITAIHSIPFFVYKALGLYEYGYLTILAIQSVLYISVAAIPLPGAVGVSESGFITLYKVMYPAEVLGSAMLLSRGISFYLLVIISCISSLITHLLDLKK